MLIHEFRYRKNDLYCEGVRLAGLAEYVGTPCYVYSYKTFVDHLSGLGQALKSVHPLICYSMKACSNLALLCALIKKGAGLDIVSGGELFRAKKAGCPGKRIVFAGVGKREDEICEAMRYGILLFNVESRGELEAIERVATALKRKQDVALRLNPDVGAGAHAYTTTGSDKNKFGIGFDIAKEIFASARQWPHLNICGIHVHIGSQILEGEPFAEAIKKTVLFLDELRREKVVIRYLDLGGGLGIIYDNEKPLTPAEYAGKILPLLGNVKCRIIFEPGRFIAGNSGIFLTQVLYVKSGAKKNFIIVDGAMNDLIRPALYDSFHDICPLRRNGEDDMFRGDVVGPVCESGDFLARERLLPSVRPGDYLAVLSAGAYGFSMSSNYNSRPRAAEVLVKGSKYYIIRKRESREDLIRGEKIPAFLKSRDGPRRFRRAGRHLPV